MDFFSDNISLSNGITLLKFIVSSLLIFWIFCISNSLEARLAFLTSYSSWDINSRIASRTSSNFYRIIFLNRNLDPNFLLDWFMFWLGLISTWALKKEKKSLNQIRVVNLVKLEDLPLATFIRIEIVLLMVYSFMYCYNLPSWNFSFISLSKLFKHSYVLFLKFFSLSPSINSKSSKI